MRLLENDPPRRWQTELEVVVDLERFKTRQIAD